MALKKYEVKFPNGTSTTMKLTPEHAKEYEANGAQVSALGESVPKTAKKTTASNKKRTAKNK